MRYIGIYRCKDNKFLVKKEMKMDGSNRQAPDGKIWVCMACGKISKNKYGTDPYRSHGWDESCFVNSELYDESRLVFDDDKRYVIKIKD
jgi:hypothetical protein